MSFIINSYQFGNLWTPADLTQAVARYKWADMVGFADNDPVGTWVDTIGAFDATGSGGARPLYKSAGYVAFDGTDDTLDTGITTAFTDFAVFIVFRVADVTQAGDRLVDKKFNTGFWMGNDTAGSSTIGGGILESGSPFGHFIAASSNTWYAMLFQRGGTTKTIRLAGSSDTQSVSGSALDTTSLIMAHDVGGSTYTQMDMKELVVCNDDISGGDLTSLISYASSEYGLTL